MRLRSFFLVGAAVVAGSAANAHSVTIIGNNADAMACFRAADSEVRRPEAVQVCAAALNSSDLDNQDRMATLVNRGVVHFRLENFEAAAADFDAALAMVPGQPDALINRGITLLASGGDDAEAMAMIDQGLAGRPERPWVGYYGRAVAHELAGRDGQAYRDYQRARELRPGWRPAELALTRFSVRS